MKKTHSGDLLVELTRNLKFILAADKLRGLLADKLSSQAELVTRFSLTDILEVLDVYAAATTGAVLSAICSGIHGDDSDHMVSENKADIIVTGLRAFKSEQKVYRCLVQ